MNAVIMSFDPNEKQSERYENQLGKLKITCTRPVCERASEIRERTLHTPRGRQEQNRMRMVSMSDSRGSDRF